MKTCLECLDLPRLKLWNTVWWKDHIFNHVNINYTNILYSHIKITFINVTVYNKTLENIISHFLKYFYRYLKAILSTVKYSNSKEKFHLHYFFIHILDFTKHALFSHFSTSTSKTAKTSETGWIFIKLQKSSSTISNKRWSFLSS